MVCVSATSSTVLRRANPMPTMRPRRCMLLREVHSPEGIAPAARPFWQVETPVVAELALVSGTLSEASVSVAPMRCPPIPSQECVASVQKWALQDTHTLGFRVDTGNGLKALTRQLAHTLLPCTDAATRPVLVDVGAAMHSTKMWFKRMNPDDSDALYLLAGFNDVADVHAFESNANKAQEIEDVARQREQTAPFVHRLSVHAMGVGDEVRRDRVARCGYANTWQLEQTAPDQGRTCPLGEAINVTTLDAFAADMSWRRILYVKVDVEGGELQVVNGMQRLLRERRVELASFEYAVNWHPLFSKAGALTPDEILRLKNASLAHFQQTLYAHGYHTYLIHAAPARWMGKTQRRTLNRFKNEPVITLLPVYGRFWHPAFEICADRKRFYKHLGHCWNDLLVVRRGNRCVKQRILKLLHGPDDVYPECQGCI